MDKAANLTGKMLIAMPGMRDPRFEQSVILICSHSDDGAMGLVVNRPMPDLDFSDLLAQLNKGASFEALAREHSDDKGSAARGGDLGKFGRGRMVPPFEEAVFALTSPGQRSGLVKSQFGYHIIELTGKEPAGKVSFDEVKDELKKEALERLDGQNRRMLWDEAQKGIEYDQAAIEAQARAAGGAKP